MNADERGSKSALMYVHLSLFFSCNVFPLEHLQHAIGDHETADDVCGRADDRDEAKNGADGIVSGAGGDE